MEIIKNSLNIDFVGKVKLFAGISTVLVVISLILIFTKGLNYGVDFAGGTEIQVKIDGTTTAELRNALAEVGDVEIQNFEGKGDQFLLKLPKISTVDAPAVNGYIDEFKAQFPEAALLKKHFDAEVGDRIEIWFDKPVDTTKVADLYKKHNIPTSGIIGYKQVGERHIYTVMLVGFTNKVIEIASKKLGKTIELERVELVGPKVGKKLRIDAFMSVIYSLICLLVYIAFRFNYRFSPGAILCLAHDVAITTGLFVILRIPFDLTVVAALLSLVGYSLNDTIVVYDRIRENMNDDSKGATLSEKINTSLNETLSRTIMTSAMTLIAVVSLLIWGGGIIRGFSVAMTFGIVIGTYSSIYIAAPLTIFIDNYINKKKAA